MVGSKFATPLASLVTPKDMDIADRDSRTWFSHCFFIYPRSILPEFNIYRRSTSLLVRAFKVEPGLYVSKFGFCSWFVGRFVFIDSFVAHGEPMDMAIFSVSRARQVL